MASSKSYKFDSSLWFTYLNPRYLATDKNGDRYYARLAKGEKTIKEKDQSEFAKSYRLFIDGELKSFDDKLEQEWITNHPDFGNRIIEFNPAAEHEANIELIKGTNETMQRILKLEETETRGIGYRKFGRSAISQDINELKAMIISLANEDFEAVNQLLDETTESDFALIGLAMAKDIIYEGKGGNDVRFRDTDEVLTTVRANERPIDALSSFLQTNPGKEMKKIIFQKLEPMVVEEIVETQTKSKGGRPPSK